MEFGMSELKISFWMKVSFLTDVYLKKMQNPQKNQIEIYGLNLGTNIEAGIRMELTADESVVLCV